MSAFPLHFVISTARNEYTLLSASGQAYADRHIYNKKENKMKKPSLIPLSVFLCFILIPLSLSACNDSSTSSDGKSSDATVEQNISVDSYEQQIAYYMELSESLQNEILTLKEEAYVESCEKDLKISELEQTVKSLQNTIASMNNVETPRPDGDLHSPILDQVVSKSDYEYEERDGYIIITRYVGTQTELTLPSEIGGLPVYEIGDYAFKDCSVESVTIPSSVKKIGWFAFSGCSRLESVSIPSSISSIGYGAFDSCATSLTVVCEGGSYAESFAQSWGFALFVK